MIRQFSHWLAATPMSATLQQVAWAIPALQIVHILSISAAFSSIVLMSARLLGLNREFNIDNFVRINLRILLISVLMLVITGSILVISEPGRDLLNPIFWTKMALLVTGLISLGLLVSLRSNTNAGNVRVASRRYLEPSLAIILIAIWVGIVVCGRWIAYFDAGAN